MDVTAYNSVNNKSLSLGAIADGVWTSGFKRSQMRSIQVSNPIGATTPNVFDRITKLENFSFAAGQSLTDLGSAVQFMATWPDQVPNLAHLSFSQGGSIVWLGWCGIEKVELIEKQALLVVFGYTIVGGAWSSNKPF